MASTIEVRGAADFHVHLRQGALSSLVTPHVRSGGFGLAYVMVKHCARTQIRKDLLTFRLLNVA